MRCLVVLLTSSTIAFYRCSGTSPSPQLVPVSVLHGNVLCNVGRGLDVRFICPTRPLPRSCCATVSAVSRVGVIPCDLTTRNSIIIVGNYRSIAVRTAGACILHIAVSRLYTGAKCLAAVVPHVTQLGVILASLTAVDSDSYRECRRYLTALIAIVTRTCTSNLTPRIGVLASHVVLARVGGYNNNRAGVALTPSKGFCIYPTFCCSRDCSVNAVSSNLTIGGTRLCHLSRTPVYHRYSTCRYHHYI